MGLCLAGAVHAQVVRDHRNNQPGKQPVTTVRPVNNQAVTIYEHGNYGGRMKSLVAGTYRFYSAADMNDMVSSLRVPAGMAVLIYEHANEKGGFGNYTDLLEDCPDLSIYDLNDKTSYLSVFSLSRPGYVYARGKTVNGQYVAGHWERQRADGRKPDNAPPAIVSFLPEFFDPNDMANAPLATQAELDEFEQIRNNQQNVGVLGGETTKPIYYHHNKAGEEVYKYNKVIDPARLPGKFFDWAADKLGRAGFIVKPFELATEIATDIKDWIFGSSSTKMEMDCWYPVSEYRKTVCGTLKEDNKICTQDYLHTKVTVDKDVCFYLKPHANFNSMLSNRWTGQTHDGIEGEVKPFYPVNYNTQTGKSVETLTPRNPLLLQLKENDQVCLYGAWMGDIMDINLKVPIPFTDESIDIANIDLRSSNEIHPVNQFWRKAGQEWQLTAITDGTGYFEKKGNGEVEASGLNQRMRFYYAFIIPGKPGALDPAFREYHVNGVGFEFTDIPAREVAAETLTLKHNGVVRLKVNDNSFIRNQRTHRVFFDKVRKRPNGYIQGYIVVETEPIAKRGGSINLFIKDVTVNNSPANPDRLPVREQ